MAVSLEQHRAGTTLRIEGEMTIYSAAEIKLQLQRALSAGGTFEVDLGAVSEMDSAGVQLLLAARREAERQGAALFMTRGSEAVRQALGLCSLDALVSDQAPNP